MEIINIIVQEALVVMVIIMPQQQLQQLLDMVQQDMLDNIIIRLPTSFGVIKYSFHSFYVIGLAAAYSIVLYFNNLMNWYDA